MNLRVELPPEVVDEIVEQVAARVLAHLADNGSAPTSGPQSPYMTVEEAAEYLRCGRHKDGKIKRQRIDDLLSSRRLARVKDGSRTLVLRSEIEAHLMTEGRRA